MYPLAALQRAKPTFSRMGLLRLLQVPRDARWEAVAPLVKEQIVLARRNDDEDLAKSWSQAKEFLKRNLAHTCIDCGVACESYRCGVCYLPDIRRGRELNSKQHGNRIYHPVS
jgi:hypothetical protein